MDSHLWKRSHQKESKQGRYGAARMQWGRLQVFQHAKGQGVLAARMQLPATLLAYNGTGEKLVAAGEDQSILLINIKTVDGNLKACLPPSLLLWVISCETALHTCASRWTAQRSCRLTASLTQDLRHAAASVLLQNVHSSPVPFPRSHQSRCVGEPLQGSNAWSWAVH